jgi:hypothetical protein
MYNAFPPIATGAAAARKAAVNRRKQGGAKCALHAALGGPHRCTSVFGGVVSARVLPLILHGKTDGASVSVKVDQLVIAGWTGRDKAAVEKHIAELAALGVKRPPTTPVFYRASAARLTLDDEIEVLGETSSGEVEFVLLQHAGRLWVGTGSDHTDRQVETYVVSVSKQMCDKPIAAEFWAYDDVAPHWDRLVLRSHISEKTGRALYQEGSVAAMLDPKELTAQFSDKAGLADGTLMFCGTLAAHGAVRASPSFEFALKDPVLNRTIHHRYSVRSLPVLG